MLQLLWWKWNGLPSTIRENFQDSITKIFVHLPCTSTIIVVIGQFPSCTFIWACTFIFRRKFFPPARLLEPARLFFTIILPPCTLIRACTLIRKPRVRGHVHSAHAARGGGGVSKLRAAACRGGGGVWPLSAHAMGSPKRPQGCLNRPSNETISVWKKNPHILW